jgi:hypothetical protein
LETVLEQVMKHHHKVANCCVFLADPHVLNRFEQIWNVQLLPRTFTQQLGLVFDPEAKVLVVVRWLAGNQRRLW